MPVFLLSMLACGPKPPVASPPMPEPPPSPTCTFLTINDTYRIEANADGTGGMARVRTLRKRLEEKYGAVALLHAGDFLSPSLMSRMYGGAQMVEVMSALDGDPSAVDDKMWAVFGNHEFDASKAEDGPKLDGYIASSGFHWLGTNVKFANGADGAPVVADPKLTDTGRFDCGGIAVGIYGLTIDKKKADFVTEFTDPVETARVTSAALRAGGAELIVALTHQTVEADAALLQALGAAGPDLIVGGHEHNHQEQEVDGRGVYKADADAATAWRVTLRKGPDGTITRDEELLTLDASIPEDAAVKALVDKWVAKNDADFCAKAGQAAGCLKAPVGKTKVPLVGAELEIRRFETNLGDWVADVARAAYPGAQIAAINAGSLRLNRDLAAGPITRADIEELFAYPMPLVRLEVDGATLQKMMNRATEEWQGNGHWLQVSGIAWVHDPAPGTATRLTLLPDEKPIVATQKYVIVVPEYLLTGSDGYKSFLPPAPKGAPGPDLKQLVLDAFAKAPDGIEPKVEGRICNTQRPGVCLATP